MRDPKLAHILVSTVSVSAYSYQELLAAMHNMLFQLIPSPLF